MPSVEVEGRLNLTLSSAQQTKLKSLSHWYGSNTTYAIRRIVAKFLHETNHGTPYVPSVDVDDGHYMILYFEPSWLEEMQVMARTQYHMHINQFIATTIDFGYNQYLERITS